MIDAAFEPGNRLTGQISATNLNSVRCLRQYDGEC
jgi:hypothetical protein